MYELTVQRKFWRERKNEGVEESVEKTQRY